MNRNQKRIYCFIYDDAKNFYRAKAMPNGTWAISNSPQMYPLYHNPDNLIESPLEAATNRQYFSMARSISYPLRFILDGAAILNSRYHLGKGVNENLYFAMFEFDENEGVNGKYKLSYNGRFDFQQKKRDEKISTFTVPLVDDSAWAILSQNDDVEYAIDSSANNPKAIKVLFDDFTLKNRYTFQTVNAPIVKIAANNTFSIPFVLANQDGDSFGIVTKNQTGDSNITTSTWGAPNTYAEESINYFEYTFYQINGSNYSGTFKFGWSNINSIIPSGGLWIFFRTSKGQNRIIFTNGNTAATPPGDLVNIPVQTAYNLVPGKIYSVDFSFNLNLEPGEKVFFFAQLNDNAANLFTITPIVTSIFVSMLTKAESAICYGLRPLDLLQEIVKKATLERYTIGSEFFEINNKTVLISGESLRGISNPKIYTSFKDFFESFSALFFMALRVVNGSLFIELADEIYKRDTNIIDLGEIIECETEPASEYMANEIHVGSPRQDYRHASGRLEFNAPQKYSLPFTNLKNKINWISKYRTDCYGMIFLMLDYRGQSTEDNKGDKQVFIVDITDEQGAALENIETFESVTINNAPLAPYIKYPLTGDIINNNKPFLKGVGIPGNNVNIYVNTALDGGTVVDVNGNWTYQIVTSLPSYDPGVFDGVALIQATNTDLLGATDDIQLIIDTVNSAAIEVIYPKLNDSLYNNKPLIRGVAPAGTNINIFLDGLLLAAVVADNSCKFEYKVVVPITNGNHLINIGGADIPFTVQAFTQYPIITYVGSELDGFPVVNNMPLIQGVGTPGEIVTLWLNYVSYNNIGQALIDANGNWEFQLVPTSYNDPVSGLPVDLVPVANGLNIFSTLLVNNSVKVNVSGFKLNRPAYDSITGVPDNTVFNTRLSNRRAMMNHKSILSAIMNKQRNDLIKFQSHDKNPNLRTVLGTEIFTERADIQPSSLGTPIAILEWARIKVVAKRRFAEILYSFNNGGTIKGTFKGKELFFLPIGDMKMKSIMDDVQDWRVLISPQTTYSQLLNLYKRGLTINLMDKAIFHSDYNSLHIVEYGKVISNKYNSASIYDDWFTNRNSEWFTNPQYLQKFQQSEVFRDQVVTNGVPALILRMYKCRDASLVDEFDYSPVVPSPIAVPEIVMETPDIDFSDYPEDQYFFVQYAGSTPIGISERIQTKAKWHKTILIESSHSVNSPGVFYSTGFKTIIRIEGHVGRLQPSNNHVTAKEESGNARTIYSLISRKRKIRYGNAQGIPDYLAMKMASAITNDRCYVEGELLTIDEGEKIEPAEQEKGIPMYYYEVQMLLQENSQGKVLTTGEVGSSAEGIVLVIDASAIGIPTDIVIDISEE